ncbi:MFS transporter [Saccharomonospora saliphila]|uniref:MFS transporter n=1 Tax=Saccharomonospora saliphila TaxID=369829 RepID=UPI0006627A5A|nr:MFS transporter [Saccharomonospora saliphila]
MSEANASTSSSSSAEPDSAEKWPARLWVLLTVLCLAFFLDGLDVTLIGVSLPSIGHDLGMTTAELQWIVNGYLLGSGGFLLLGGRSADLLGRRRVFLASVAVFGLASLMGGLVNDGLLLIVSRLVKGVAAGFTVPTTLSIVTTTFPEGKARNRAVAIYGAIGASGFSSGLIVGGLVTSINWRWIFLFPVPLTLAVLLVGMLVIPKDRPAAAGRYDVLGALTLTASLLLLVYTVVTAPEAGWFSGRTLVLLAAAVVLLAAFVLVEQRVRDPLIRLGIFRSGALVRANLAFVALLGSYFSFQFVITLYLQDTLGWTPLQLALALLPIGLIVAFGAPIAGRWIGRVGTPPLMLTGLLSEALGFLLLLRLDTDPSYLTAILPTTLLVGVGFALTFPAANVQAVAGVEVHEQGLAAGILNSSAQIGGAVVLAVTTAIIAAGHGPTAPGSTGPTPASMLAAFRPGLIFCAVVAFAGLVVILTQMLRRRGRVPDTAHAPATARDGD